MLRALCVALLTSLAVLHSQSPERSLGIFLKFEFAPSPESLQAMKAEVTRILEPTGFLLQWRSLDDNRGNESFSQIMVFQFHGACTDHAVENSGRAEVTLATTSV